MGGRNITVLGAVLALQLILVALFAFGGRDFGTATGGKPLIAFDRAAVGRVTVTGADGEVLELVRKEGQWSLPGHYDFPASEGKVNSLLATLDALAPRLPLATSGEARRRFKVADESFERHIDLEAEDGRMLARLYVGDSPGYRRAYVRADGADAIFEAKLDRGTISVDADSWTDREVLRRDARAIESVATGDLKLTRKDGGWSIDGLAEGEIADTEEVERMVGRIASLAFDKVLGIKAGPEEVEATLVSLQQKDGKTIEYRLVREGDDAYTLTVSDRPWRFRLMPYQAEALTGIAREKLVKAAPEGEAVGSPDEGGNEPG